MKLLFLFLLLTFLLSNETGADEIIGGKESRPHSHPYMAFLDIIRGNTWDYCGGFLIHREFVMTAAHCAGECVYSPSPSLLLTSSITVKLGAHNVRKREKTWQTISVKRQFPHPEYNDEKILNDIMLLQLENEAMMTTAVWPVPLGSRFDSDSPGQQCLVAGWGGTKPKPRGSDTLQEAELRLMNPSNCKGFNDFDERTQLCVGTPNSLKTTFSGDSGGPLVCSGVAQGIVSYGNNEEPPSGFTRIAYYSSWIDQILKAN